MSPFTEVALLGGREIRKNLRSGKGILLANIAFLIGSAVALGIVKIQEMQRERMGPVPLSKLLQMREALYSSWYDERTGQVLAQVPIELILLIQFLVWASPLLVALLGFDSISGEVQYRTIRYFSARARRASYYVAKALGIWALVAGILLVISSLGWTVIVANDVAPFGLTVSWGLRLWALTLPVVGAWTGVGMLIAAQFRTPVFSLFATFGGFFFLWLFGFAFARVFHTPALAFLFPGNFATYVLSAEPNRFVTGMAACLGTLVLTTSLGAWVLGKRDI